MPGIIAGALVAHPPILLPEVGHDASTQVAATVVAIRRLDAALAAHPADLVILCSPHSPAGSVAIPVRAGKAATGDLSRFRAPQVRVGVELDEAITHRLFEAAIEAGFPMAWAEDEPLDHGVVVPLHFLERTRANKPFVLLGLAGWGLDDFVRFGRWLHRHLEDRSAIFIASGDLSHRLIPGAPAGYRPDGQVFDRAVIDALRSNHWDQIERLDPVFIDEAGECGLRPLAMLLGAARAAGIPSTVLHYEGPFGVGYPVVQFGPPAPGQSAAALAREAIRHYLTTGQFLEPPEPIAPDLAGMSGVFVTLQRQGDLRGCVGTIRPTQPTAAHELVQSAIGAATRDPRFDPVSIAELPDLEVHVQLLETPERVESPDDLDPLRYGLIVRSGERQGLLLPGLDGLSTPDEQIAAACQKAGISPYAALELFRFRTRDVA
ncbi:MAG: AmmeMemoRadiSam system protein A [Chloroflexi bacterium]|nr:MAG: AmmeMemoRadiSam system protein A [Chloroflexota bacterium]